MGCFNQSMDHLGRGSWDYSEISVNLIFYPYIIHSIQRITFLLVYPLDPKISFVIDPLYADNNHL